MTKVTLITGGSRGIGAATARLCAAEGHAVAINYRKDAAAAEEVCLEVKSAGVEAVTVQADTGVEADIMRMFDEVDRTLGVVTNLINNAGIHGPRGRLDALSAADIDRVLDVNVLVYTQDENADKVLLYFFIGRTPKKHITFEYLFAEMD